MKNIKRKKGLGPKVSGVMPCIILVTENKKHLKFNKNPKKMLLKAVKC
jgi:hypothetical protein